MEDWNTVLPGPIAPFTFTTTHLFLKVLQCRTHRGHTTNVKVKEEFRDGTFFKLISKDLGEKSLESI